MKGTAVFKALGPIDVRNVGRDEMLRWMVFIPLLLALLARFGWPWLVTELQAHAQFDLSPYVVMLMSYLVIGAPAVFGVVIGFLLLDERDEGSLIALQVTPLSLNNYMAYRLGMPVLLTVLLLIISLPLAGVTRFAFWELLLLGFVAAPLAPLLAIFMAAFANNKVQGFALMKGAGIFFVVPFAAYFIGGNWQWLFGLLPTYWPPKLYWMIEAGESGIWPVALVGFVYQLLWIFALNRRFNRILHQ
ncbi:hypothetical protein [Candidatus Leptofilum sp.]|uniref:hypothetical protein n=1 Tax=Candidatus Leptofilum sp. TaxID=3241576 RepID=UPI003B5CD478